MHIYIPSWVFWLLFVAWPVVWLIVMETGNNRLDFFGWPSIPPTRFWIGLLANLLWVGALLMLVAFWIGKHA